MGLFGPSVKSRMKHGREEWYVRCDERDCREEISDDNRKSVERQFKTHTNEHKEQKKQIARDYGEEYVKYGIRAKEKHDQDKREEKKARKAREDALRRDMAKTARQLRKAAKGKKCPFCGKDPCRETKAECANVRADRFESSMNMDMSDPATFDKQLKWYRDNS